MRYWDFSIPSAEVKPTEISKVRGAVIILYLRFQLTDSHKINTALQLLLMGSTTISPILSVDLSAPLVGLQSVSNTHF